MLVIACVFFWKLQPSIENYDGSTAVKRLKDVFQVDASLPAQGLAVFAWPGESTQYYRFRMSKEKFDAFIEKEKLRPIKSCTFDTVPTLVNRPDWIPLSVLSENVGIFSSSKQLIWRVEESELTYLFYDSLAHGCSE